MVKWIKGQIEAEINKALVKFELEDMGRGPTEMRTWRKGYT